MVAICLQMIRLQWPLSVCHKRAKTKRLPNEMLNLANSNTEYKDGKKDGIGKAPTSSRPYPPNLSSSMVPVTDVVNDHGLQLFIHTIRYWRRSTAV